ncbi:M23 family metallopeptidase [Thioclava sp. GXIMD4216]|uniref:M23 family metallopeptidase n=1 Tax=Thioclava sp. GXIMD4216 TaxID=3131929 RepID=UPI0030D17173
MGKTCYIQNYVDHDPGPGATDSACGNLTYDGHDGTDIAVPTRADMRKTIAVYAALDGTVRATRDGEPDSAFADGASVKDKECGNGVIIDHASGWQTQYCHLKNGSILVQPGQKVTTGTTLGEIGQSGLAAFPHVHFEIRHNGQSLDPFTAGDSACTLAADHAQLWTTPIAYDGGGVLLAGLTSEIPDYDAIKQGRLPALPQEGAGRLILWIYGFGGQPEADLHATLSGGGQNLSQNIAFEKPQALYLRYIGRNVKTGLKPGTYTFTVTDTTGHITAEEVTVP